jgi:integrase
MTPHDTLLASLSDKQRKEYERFERFVLSRAVKPRDGKEGAIFVLDKRGAELGKAGRETLRSPESGATTTSREVAEAWATSHYIPKLWQIRNAASVHPNAAGLTVALAVERYKKSCMRTRRVEGGQEVQYLPRKHNSRFSMLQGHVIPAFGNLIFATLTRTMVREEAENLSVVHKLPGGVREEATASPGTQNNFITALKAVWDECFPDVAAPFAGVRVRVSQLDDDDDAPTTIFDHDSLPQLLREAEGKGALDMPAVRRLLLAAERRDRDLMARANTAKVMIPNTVYAIVLMIATGCRVSEVLKIRWCDINFEHGYIIIHSAKRRNRRRGRVKPKVRIVPLQYALLAWLEGLRQLSGIDQAAGSNVFVIRTNPKGAPTKPAAQTTISARISRALESAGLKIKGKATHWARSTYSTWGAAAPGIKGEELQHFLGHKGFSGATDEYVAMLVALLRDDHRKFIELPSPEEIAAGVEEFVPIKSDWRLRKRPKSHSKAAVEARRIVAAASQTDATR